TGLETSPEGPARPRGVARRTRRKGAATDRGSQATRRTGRAAAGRRSSGAPSPGSDAPRSGTVVHGAVRDPGPARLALLDREERAAERHLTAAEHRGAHGVEPALVAVELVHEPAVAGVARLDAIHRDELGARHVHEVRVGEVAVVQAGEPGG